MENSKDTFLELHEPEAVDSAQNDEFANAVSQVEQLWGSGGSWNLLGSSA